MAADKKSEQTKRMLTDSLKCLMAEKPLNRITVREICESCGVNRQTFYYHFTDIYDQMRWMYEQEIAVILKKNENLIFWQDGLLQLFHYIDDNRAVCLCALHSLGREHLKGFFAADVREIIGYVVQLLGRELPSFTPEYGAFLTQYYTVAVVGLLESWLLGEIQEPPEKLVMEFHTIISDQFEGAKRRDADRNK
jgi:AcrR family transcriptional regulator